MAMPNHKPSVAHSLSTESIHESWASTVVLALIRVQTIISDGTVSSYSAALVGAFT